MDPSRCTPGAPPRLCPSAVGIFTLMASVTLGCQTGGSPSDAARSIDAAVLADRPLSVDGAHATDRGAVADGATRFDVGAPTEGGDWGDLPSAQDAAPTDAALPPLAPDPCALAGPGTLAPATVRLADPSTYSAPFDLVPTGQGGLSWVSGQSDPNYGGLRNADLPVEPNTSYVLRASFRLAPSTRAWLAVDTYAAGTPKDMFGDPTVARHSTTFGVSRMRDGGDDDPNWRVACVAFTTSADETLMNLRIGGFGSDDGHGPGPVEMRDVNLQSVAPTGVWVRFAADGAPSPLTIELRGRYPSLPNVMPSFPVTVPADGAFSAWVDTTTFSPGVEIADAGGGGSVYYMLTFRDSGGGVVSDVPLRVEVTSNPAVEPYYVSPPRPLAPIVLLFLPGADTDLSWRPGLTGLMADEYQRLLDAFGARHPNEAFRVPARYHASTDMGPAGAMIDRHEIADTSSELMHRAGFNGVWSVFGYDVVEQTASHGLTRHSIPIDSVYNDMYYGTVDFDPAAQHTSALTTFGPDGFDLGRLLAPYAATPDRVLMFMFDEIQGPVLKAGPPLQQAFCRYLEDNGQADLLAVGCDTVAPLTGSVASFVESHPPEDPSAAPDAARLWYWQVRFYNAVGAEILKQVHTAATEAAGADFPVNINTGQPTSGYYSYAAGVESRELLRPRAPDGVPAITFPWAEEFALGRCYAQWSSMDADFLAALSRPAGTYGAYVHGANEGYVPHRVLSHAVRGAHYFDLFTFPVLLSNAGIPAAAWLDGAARTNDLLARVEPTLYEGKRPPAEVAIFSGQTDPLWNFADRSPECWLCSPSNEDAGLHYLLTHAHYPVDFAIEADVGDLVGGDCVTGAALDGKRALFLDRQHVAACAFAAIRAWVEAGGTLILGKALPLYDEYGLYDAARANWLGVDVGDERRTDAAAEIAWNGVVVHPPGGTPFRALAPRDPADPSVSVVGTFTAGGDAGERAVVDVARGAGVVRVAGLSVGTLYINLPISNCAGQSYVPSHLTPSGDIRPYGFDPALREAVTGVLADHGLATGRLVVPSDPLVEGQLVLDRTDGAVTGGAVVLLDYNNSTSDAIAVSVPGLSGCVTSVLDDRQYMLDGHTLALSLTDQDVLAFSTTDPACRAIWDDP